MPPYPYLVDVSMPRTGGIEASRPLLELKLDARIVYLSARENPVYRDQARALGAYGYV